MDYNQFIMSSFDVIVRRIFFGWKSLNLVGKFRNGFHTAISKHLNNFINLQPKLMPETLSNILKHSQA